MQRATRGPNRPTHCSLAQRRFTQTRTTPQIWRLQHTLDRITTATCQPVASIQPEKPAVRLLQHQDRTKWYSWTRNCKSFLRIRKLRRRDQNGTSETTLILTMNRTIAHHPAKFQMPGHGALGYKHKKSLWGVRVHEHLLPRASRVGSTCGAKLSTKSFGGNERYTRISHTS